MNTLDRFPSYCEDQGYRNNRCAGFALAAILSDIKKRKVRGLKTYENLLKQQELLLKRLDRKNASIEFLNNPLHIYDGTRMILPSSIVHYCLSLNLTSALYCSDKRDTIFQTEVFHEDREQITRYTHDLKDYESFALSADKYTYLLALTRFKHWVALKSTPNGYYLFDPAPAEFGGGLFGLAPFEELLPHKKSIFTGETPTKYFYELMIGINL